MPHLIAVDWGTSSLRGARLDQAGQVLEEKSAPLGIANVPNGDFAGVFASLFADWMTPCSSTWSQRKATLSCAASGRNSPILRPGSI